MTDREKYNMLDDIGFVGTQEKRSALQKKRDMIRTGEIIKSMKAGIFVYPPKKIKRK